MNEIVVDTDVFSYIFKGDTRAQNFRPLLAGANPHLSFMSVAELYRWAITRNWGAKQVETLKREIASYTVLDYDDDTAWQWARNMSIPGMQVAAGDAWIAASAMRHGMPLLTHNRKHYKDIPGLKLIS